MRPGELFGLDFIEDLPETKDGYQHLLTLTCYTSGTSFAYPMKTKQAWEVIEKNNYSDNQ